MEELKVKRSIRLSILFVALLPFLIIMIVSNVTTFVTLDTNLSNQVKDNLSDLAHSMGNQYDTSITGDYVLKDGVLYKGTTKLSDNYELVDLNKKETEVDFTLFYGDTRYVTSIVDPTSKQRIIGTKASAEVADVVLKQGKDYFSENVTINNTPYFGFYTPLKNADGSIVGIMFTGRPSGEIKSMINNTMIRNILYVIPLFIIAVIVILVFSKRVTTAMKSVTASLSHIANGKLNVPVEDFPQKRPDEIGVIAKAAEQTRTSLANIISEMARNTGELNQSVIDIDNIASSSHNSTSAVNQAMDELATATMHNAENTQSANMHMNEMSVLIEDIVQDVVVLTDNANSMDEIEKCAGRNLDEVTEYILSTMDAVERIVRQADITNDAAKRIGAAINIISSIAEETTLLSLNASIESARAGELGRGFGVVASQIQKLADQSSESAADIECSINELLSESSKTVTVMAEVKEIVAQQKAKIEETQGNFDILKKNISDSVDSINAIKGQTNSLKEHRGQMNSIIQELSALSEENAASTEETTATIGELDNTIANMATNSKVLSDISSTLKLRVDEFEL